MLDRILKARLVVAAVLGVLVVANAAVTFALVREAAARKTVVVVPGIAGPRETTANEPPEETVRDFVLLYLAHFDNYTASTVEESTKYLSGWLSPRFYAQATAALQRRQELVAQSRMASQLLLPRRSDAAVKRLDSGEYEVSLVAQRRVYIADKLQSEGMLVYIVGVEAGAPTVANPYGLYVTGQFIEPKRTQEARGEK